MDNNKKVLAIQEPAEDHQWQIVNRIKETPDTFTYVFSPVSASQRCAFTVGQFVTISALLKRPTATGNVDESIVQRTYSIASSPKRQLIELTIKCEKPYGHINPITKKPDGFAAYFFEQMKMGDKMNVRFNPNKDHFLSRIAEGMEKNIAYWSGANGAESARCLIQYMEDINDTELSLTLFYSNPALYAYGEVQYNNTVNVIYYDWLVDMAKKMENFKVVFTFTREKESDFSSDDPRIIYRKGRFFFNPDGKQERTLSKYHGNIEASFNPICGSSGFINGIVKRADGRVERGRGIMQDLIDIEGVRPEHIDKEQFYLQIEGATK
jgi:ferredoxin-NADP reductase